MKITKQMIDYIKGSWSDFEDYDFKDIKSWAIYKMILESKDIRDQMKTYGYVSGYNIDLLEEFDLMNCKELKYSPEEIKELYKQIRKAQRSKNENN